MKIAGQKNDGAWFRANKVLVAMNNTDRASLTAKLQATPFATLAFNDMRDLAIQSGVENENFPMNAGGWISRMLTFGIPRQVWMGKLTFTTYTKDQVSGKYVANYQSNIGYFANDLRKVVVHYIRAIRQSKDVFDVGNLGEGNPGGMPDANKLT